jgi:hypothetical protein
MHAQGARTVEWARATRNSAPAADRVCGLGPWPHASAAFARHSGPTPIVHPTLRLTGECHVHNDRTDDSALGLA